LSPLDYKLGIDVLTANVQPDCQRSGPQRSSLQAQTAGLEIPLTAGLKFVFGDKRPRATDAAGATSLPRFQRRKGKIGCLVW
jgi:hypothetical protein